MAATLERDEVTAERSRRFWSERVEKYEAELRAFNAGNATRSRSEIEADLARVLRKVREAEAL
jgi:hypothetical protein